MRSRTVSANGHELALLEAGEGGRPFLLVHGFTGAKEDFADHLDALAELGWWAVAPDLRGHGASAKPGEEADYSLQHYADDLAALVGELGWASFVLLGHSMGGMVAQLLALDPPVPLDGLILMDTSHGPIPGVDPAMAALGVEIVRDGGMEAVKAVLDELGDDAPLGSEAYERTRRERPGYDDFVDGKFLASSPAMYASMLLQLLDQDDRLDELAGLEVPTLVIVGDQDESFLDASDRLAGAIPGATLETVVDAGHSPQFENAEGWWKAVSGFLGRL